MVSTTWVRIAVEADATREEWVTAALGELLGEVTLEILDHRARRLVPELADLAHGRVLVRAYVPADQANALNTQLHKLPDVVVHPATRITDDWKSDWKRFFRAVRIGEHFVVRPPWEDIGNPAQGDLEIVIDPGMAFGTGTHETTQLCLSAMEQCVTRGQSVLDVGCGSGVLSIAAAKMGARQVVAIDVDTAAIAAAQANTEANGVGAQVAVSGAMLAEISQRYDVVFANILSSILIDLREQLCARLRPGGQLLLSGLLVDEVDYVSEQFSLLGLRRERCLVERDWACLHYRSVK